MKADPQQQLPLLIYQDGPHIIRDVILSVVEPEENDSVTQERCGRPDTSEIVPQPSYFMKHVAAFGGFGLTQTGQQEGYPTPKLDGGDVATNTKSSHTSDVVIAFALAIRAGK